MLRLSPESLTDRQLLERFAQQRDEAAFAVLVKRHGPTVANVCQRVLGNSHDADDAFQTTFVVLVRKAGVIRRPEKLGNWLYGVAYRVARKALVQAYRRRQIERAPRPTREAEHHHDDPLHESKTLLLRELQDLPAQYRAPLALCYLEGLTNEAAAHRLGWPTGSMSYRLARGRNLLRARLDRWGDLQGQSVPTPPAMGTAASVRSMEN
jgi:RNA polymerase sigma factor (sigma-70 family)